jgi:hypothetical protein
LAVGKNAVLNILSKKAKREGTGWIFIQKTRKLGLRFHNQFN